jgi:hypothetical protein
MLVQWRNSRLISGKPGVRFPDVPLQKKKGGRHSEAEKKREIYSGDNSGRNDGVDYHGA